MSEIAAALAGGVASLAGSAMDYKAQKKALEQAEKDRVRNIGFIEQYGSNAIESLTPAYQNAQNIQQQATNQNLQRTGDIFRPMVSTIQDGDYMAQQAALAGLMGQRNAILGDSINYGALQAQRVPVNFNALSGLTNPQTLDYANFQVPEYGASSNTQAQSNWTDFNAQQYLAANPDIEPDYMRLRPQLLAGGDPQFTTVQGYAKWHWDNYGKQSGRPSAPTNTGTKQPASFSTEQVKNALNSGGTARSGDANSESEL